MTGEIFRAYVEQCLRSHTQTRGHRCDGQSAGPQGSRCPRGYRSCGRRLRYLPQYSPDLNPIEMAFSKLKAHSAESSRANHSASLTRGSAPSSRIQSARMCQLFQTCRLCFHMTGIRFNIPVMTTSDVPEQDRLANAIVRGLGEGAGAGDGAAAIIKPVTGDLPIWDLGHEKLHTPWKRSSVLRTADSGSNGGPKRYLSRRLITASKITTSRHPWRHKQLRRRARSTARWE